MTTTSKILSRWVSNPTRPIIRKQDCLQIIVINSLTRCPLGENYGDKIPPYEMTGVNTFPSEMSGKDKPVEVPANREIPVEILNSHCVPAELPLTRISAASTKGLSPASPTHRSHALFKQTIKPVKVPARKPLPDRPNVTENNFF